MAATLHSVCGKIGAGKSTLSAGLARQPDAIMIAEDAWLARLFPGEIDDLQAYRDRSLRLRQALAPHVQALLTAGISVVLDFPANRVETRAWARAIAQAAGAEHLVHWLDVPDAVCLARLRSRNAAGAHPFRTSDEQFTQITALFQPPRLEEGSRIVQHLEPG